MSFHELDKKQVAYVLVGIMLGVLLAALDSSIVGTAMPTIIKELKGIEHYNWPFTSYMLLSTLIIPVSGKLSDMYGKKLIYSLGIVVFLIGSILCGIAGSLVQLIIYRGLQGLGGGIIISSSFAIVGEIFSPRERGKYMGLVASMFGLASILGPTLGGYITDAWGWRWIFYVNIPLGCIALAAILFALPAHKGDGQKQTFDYAGLAAFILSMVPLLLALSWGGRDYAWNSPTILGLAVFSFIFLGIFIWMERRATNPLIPPKYFNNSIFNVSIAAMFLSSTAMFSTIIFLPLYAQNVLGKSASNTGTVVTPMMLSFVVAAILSGRIVSKTGKYKIIAITGFGISILGMYLLSQMGEKVSDGMLILNMVITGFGLGATTPTFNIAVQNAFPQREIGTVTASFTFFRNLGSSMGAAILGAFMQWDIKPKMEAVLTKIPAGTISKMPPQMAGYLHNPEKLQNPGLLGQFMQSLPNSLKMQIGLGFRSALSAAVMDVFLIAVFVAFVGFLLAFALKEIPLKSSLHPEEAPPLIVE